MGSVSLPPSIGVIGGEGGILDSSSMCSMNLPVARFRREPLVLADSGLSVDAAVSAAELSPSESTGVCSLRRVLRRAGVSTMPSKSSFFL